MEVLPNISVILDCNLYSCELVIIFSASCLPCTKDVGFRIESTVFNETLCKSYLILLGLVYACFTLFSSLFLAMLGAWL